MGEVGARTLYEPVEVAIDRVRASGLVKDRIELFEPDESGTFSTTLLREAVDKVRDFDGLWRAYTEAENEPLVLPALVIQVPDKASQAELIELVTVVEQQWPGLSKYAIVNVFGEHTDLVVGTRTVRYVAPETIEDDHHIRVVLAQGSNLDRLGLPASRSPLQRTSSVRRNTHRPSRRPNGPPTACTAHHYG